MKHIPEKKMAEAEISIFVLAVIRSAGITTRRYGSNSGLMA